MNSMYKEMTHSHNFIFRKTPLCMEYESMQTVFCESKGENSSNNSKKSTNRLEAFPTLHTPYHVNDGE